MLTGMPHGMDFATAAAIPLAGMTALQALRDACGLPMSGATQRVLIVGASGGVGHLGVQIAVATGAHVTGVCSGRNADLVRGLGAHEVIDYTRADAFAGQAPFDIILDAVGGPCAPWLPRLRSDGHYASVVPGPAVIARALLNLVSGQKVHPVMLTPNAADLALLDGLFAAGKLRCVIDSHFALDQLGQAWTRSQSGRATGKIVVSI
jgi:NADPH:quinone reductase-like Zn-dependent oxidoreductase